MISRISGYFNLNPHALPLQHLNTDLHPALHTPSLLPLPLRPIHDAFQKFGKLSFMTLLDSPSVSLLISLIFAYS